MSIFGNIVVYIVIWWICLFTVLPWNVRSQIEDNQKIYLGTDLGAPVHSNILLKIFITTGISFLIWCGITLLFIFDILSLSDFI
jgi:predicted secreted protein